MVADSQPGHIDQIKQTNAGAVYRLIDQLGPVSRIDLSRFAQLAPASITKIVREMLEAHLVQETEIQEPGSRGRPAVGLMVETEAWHYLAVRISRGEIHLSLRDLSSQLVVEDQLELAQMRMAQSMSSLLHQRPLSVEWLCQAALQGDLLARDIISGVGNHVGRILAIMVNLFNPQKILIGSPFNLAAEILFPAISSCIRQQSLPAYSRHITVESTQFSNRGTMAGAALVKDALYNGSLLIRLLQG
ncbi:TPA: ROK family protein [Klebsiella pneumoniae]